MAIRPSMALRVLRSSTRPAVAQTLSVSRPRWESSVPSNDSKVPDLPDTNQPDYSIPHDRATSTFTPVAKHVQDGSEDSQILPAALTSGAPLELQARQVRIYCETKPATQSGHWRAHQWRLDWDILPRGHRWENPLMGWQSSGDYMQGTRLLFDSKEEAIRFAEKQGYEYFVQEPEARHFKAKSYADNFLYSARKLKQVRTK